jgi:hypothetical protein
MGRRAARVDENQTKIVNALRDAKATVQSLSREGMGVPDLLVGYRGINYLMEVKNPDRSAKRQLPNSVWQQPWHDAWRGQVIVVKSIDEALGVIGIGSLRTVKVPHRGQVS